MGIKRVVNWAFYICNNIIDRETLRAEIGLSMQAEIKIEQESSRQLSSHTAFRENLIDD